MKPVVFLFHGMGQHKEGWQDAVVQSFDDIVSQNKYAVFAQKSVGDVFDFVPLGYDHILREAVGRVEDSADLLKSLEPFSDEAKELGDWIGGTSLKQRKFIWSHAMDVILYRLHTPTRQRIRTAVIEIMAKKIREVLSSSPMTPVSVLAHSLGTAVAHDAIHLLGSQQWGGVPNAFAPNIWKFKTIAMLANVSRLLESDISVTDSIVRPGPIGDVVSYSSVFLNYRHELDPIPWPQMFSTAGFPRGCTDDAVIRHFHAPNVHGWSHYLVNPRVHVPLLRMLLGDLSAITAAEELAAHERFERWGGEFAPIVDKIDQVKTELPEDLRTVADAFGANPSLKDIAVAITLARKTFEKYEKIVDELKEEI